MKCQVCQKDCEEIFEGIILGKYKVKYYFCKKFPDEIEETKCEECWNNYLLNILNNKF